MQCYLRLIPLCLAGVLATVLGHAPIAHASPSHREYADTCRFYSNLAFQDRRLGRETTFRMQLAQDCVDAIVYAQSRDADVRARALSYLVDLERFRATQISLMAARAEALGQGEAWEEFAWRPAVHPVSRTGAYLIAREMGLIETHVDWTAWRRSAALPLFRLDEVHRN